MGKLTLISTFYNVQAQMLGIKEFSPSKIILLKQSNEKNAELRKNEALLRKTVGTVCKVESVELKDPYDVLEVAEKTVKLIESEKKAGNKIIMNLTGGRRTQALGVLFAAYARSDMVERLVYAPSDANRIVDLPKLNLSPSKKKREILELMAKNSHKTMSALAKKLGKTRGMLYVHLRELKEVGYLDENYNLTMAGRLALL